eukprot:6477783-Amphidinium_carterae.1
MVRASRAYASQLSRHKPSGQLGGQARVCGVSHEKLVATYVGCPVRPNAEFIGTAHAFERTFIQHGTPVILNERLWQFRLIP